MIRSNINREAAKISALSSCKINKHEYLAGEEILPSNQKQIIEQAKFTYSPLGKAFEKETKTIEALRKKCPNSEFILVRNFPAFGLNTERYRVSLHIQPECGKMRTMITPNTDTFRAMKTKDKHESKQLKIIKNN